MLLFKIIENNEIDAYFRLGWLIKGWLCPAGLGRGLGECPEGAVNRKKHPLNLFSIILDPAFHH